MMINEFKLVDKSCWDQNFGFLVINEDNDVDKGRYKYLVDKIIVSKQNQSWKRAHWYSSWSKLSKQFQRNIAIQSGQKQGRPADFLEHSSL